MGIDPGKLAPVERSVHVPLRPKEAFRLFTERMEEWWPLETHSIAAGREEEPAGLTVEPREGGRIFETAPDGTEAAWGRIRDWQPGARLGITWHVGRDEAEATEVTVTFTPTDQGTMVHLVHDGWEALGGAATAIQAGYGPGWELVLGRFALAVGRIVPA
ncbi:SRPBCC domain-containing protein [Pseudoroseicyclus sp. CXY001]|uniref:SRPBCC domain-containing protein n=1 Tax=Pseudoroseicyclus sp. CXY001 TaxID=3242492 RepID=UPI00358DAAC6